MGEPPKVIKTWQQDLVIDLTNYHYAVTLVSASAQQIIARVSQPLARVYMVAPPKSARFVDAQCCRPRSLKCPILESVG